MRLTVGELEAVRDEAMRLCEDGDLDDYFSDAYYDLAMVADRVLAMMARLAASQDLDERSDHK